MAGVVFKEQIMLIISLACFLNNAASANGNSSGCEGTDPAVAVIPSGCNAKHFLILLTETVNED